MKVLLITDNHSAEFGGAEKQFFTLKNALKKNTSIEVYSLGWGTKKIRGEDYLILAETPFKFLRQWWRMFFHPLQYWQIRRYIKKINPDVIHVHNIKKYTIALLKALRNYPVVQTVHDYSYLCPTMWNVHKDLEPCEKGMHFKCLWQHKRQQNILAYTALLFSFFRMRRLAKKTIKKFIAHSPLLENYLKMNGFDVTHILPFIEKSTTLTLNPSPSEAGEGNYFLYVGQLEKNKGVDILIREFMVALRSNPNLILKIAGTGSEENLLKTLVKELNLEKNIHFLGWVNDKKKLYGECISVIFPSVWLESFGLVITEAMQYQKPVIGSNRGSVPWLIEHEKTGLLFDPLQKHALADAMLKLVDNPKLAEQYGQCAFAKLQNFAGESEIVKQLTEFYLQTLRPPRSG